MDRWRHASIKGVEPGTASHQSSIVLNHVQEMLCQQGFPIPTVYMKHQRVFEHSLLADSSLRHAMVTCMFSKGLAHI